MCRKSIEKKHTFSEFLYFSFIFLSFLASFSFIFLSFLASFLHFPSYFCPPILNYIYNIPESSVVVQITSSELQEPVT